jgi:hypothetical protein
MSKPLNFGSFKFQDHTKCCGAIRMMPTLAEIARQFAHKSRRGTYAPVQIFHEKQLMQLRPGRFPVAPRWRGHAMNVSFSSLEPIVLQ